VNEQIRAREVRLVGPEGEQVGIVPLERALQLAADVDLDLVEVAPMARPPVCKLMDFGKFKYESALKAREARRNQQQTVIKEMKLRPKIDPHDYETKKGHVVRFLKAGDKVKVTIMFRGREQSRPELGFRLRRGQSQTGRPQHDHGVGPASGHQGCRGIRGDRCSREQGSPAARGRWCRRSAGHDCRHHRRVEISPAPGEHGKRRSKCRR
jgi:translation initiation factor IF-3